MNVPFVRVAFYSLLPLLTLSNLCLAQQGDGVKNTPGREWQVRYHINDPNKTGDIALRLAVTKVANRAKKISATLWRYDDKDGAKYLLRNDGGGQILMSGKITKNQGEGSRRKREQFELKGSYTDTDGKNHIVRILGFHFAGNNKAGSNRGDDQLVIRVSDKSPTEDAAGAKSYAMAGDCDEQPPDEDVLTEENPVDPPVYDPEDP